MKSPRGIRGVICERFGWTLHYLENGIPWADVNEMMADAPMFIPNDKTGVTGPEIPGQTNIITAESVEPETEKTPGQKLNSFLSKYL